MRRDFTPFVASFGQDDHPRPEQLAQVWKALRRALHRELSNRGLWHAPPSYLGVVGWTAWGEAFHEGDLDRTLDALDELTADCLSFVFVRRLQSLRAQLEIKGSIEGLVLLSVRNFVYGRQRRHDPLGFRVFEALRQAVRRGLDEGWLRVESGDARVRNGTVLSLPKARADGDPPALAELAGEWAPDLFPELVAARGGERAVAVDRLARCIRSLGGAGVSTFRFAELIRPLKREMRGCWVARLGQDLGPDATDLGARGLTATGGVAGARLEHRQDFELLASCVSRRIAEVEETPRTRQHLEKLWAYLRDHAGGTLDPAVAEDRLPSRRRLARQLGIPRNRLPGLFALLQRLLGECRPEALTGKPAGLVDETRRAG